LAVWLVSYTVETNGAVQVIAQVQNIGAPGATNTVLAIRPADSSHVLLTVPVPALQPGQLAQVALDLPPGTQLPGSWLYTLHADDTGLIANDVNTNNNFATFAVNLWLESGASNLVMVNTTCVPDGAGTAAGGGIVSVGANVTVTAVANPGYVFAGWIEDGTVLSMSNSFSITATSRRNLVASFSPITSISIDSVFAGSGGFTFSFTHAPGASLTVLCTTNVALPLSNWTVLGSVTEVSAGEYQFTDPQTTTNEQRFYRVSSP
jgi:uncharacterized repeat protein (TIGR02543 family)